MATVERHSMSMAHPKKGDMPISWDKNNPDEIEQAQASFDHLTKGKGYTAYAMNKEGKKGEQIKKFDPKLERIMLVPQLVGG